ncbi:MAG: alpha/beta hydrolase [Flavobacteriaceae bacterium]|nr:alpha/beta hydrolase [Flavobacteriaceae bacterium]
MKNKLVLFAFILMSTTLLSQTPKKSELVSINGKKIHYEVYGKGKPLLLLHGYTLSSKHWLPYVKDFDQEYEVYVIDLTGHGKSDPFNETLSIKSVAKDLNALIEYLKLDRIKAIGFSFGGDVLYQLALLKPNLIESMITIGAVGTWSVEDFPEYKKAFTFEKRGDFSWLKDYHKTDERIKALMEQFTNYIVKVSTAELQSIKPEVLIMIGDDDEGMDFTEIARVKKNVPNSDLWILPNVSHGAHEGETKGEFILKAKAFLNKKR